MGKLRVADPAAMLEMCEMHFFQTKFKDQRTGNITLFVTDGRTDGRADGRTDGRTDGQNCNDIVLSHDHNFFKSIKKLIHQNFLFELAK